MVKKVPMKTFGKHLIIELFGSPFKLLNDEAYIRKVILDAAKAAKLTIIDCVTHKFQPQGVTGVVVVAESHLSIHTWPESSYAAIDVFTCGKGDPYDAYKLLVRRLKPKNSYVSQIMRGMLTKR